MKLDFKKALNIPFSEEDWLRKIGIGALLFLPGLISDLSIGADHHITTSLYLIATFIISGYTILSAHFEVKSSNITLPDWDLYECVILSLKLWVISTAWLLMLAPIVIIASVICAFVPALIIPVFIIGIPIAIAFILTLNIAESFFLDNLLLKDSFDFKRILHFLKNHYSKYLLYVFLLIGVVIIYGIITGIISGITTMIFNKAVGNFIANIISILVLLTTMNLLAQTYKEAMKDDNFLIPEETDSLL